MFCDGGGGLVPRCFPFCVAVLVSLLSSSINAYCFVKHISNTRKESAIRLFKKFHEFLFHWQSSLSSSSSSSSSSFSISFISLNLVNQTINVDIDVNVVPTTLPQQVGPRPRGIQFLVDSIRWSKEENVQSVVQVLHQGVSQRDTRRHEDNNINNSNSNNRVPTTTRNKSTTTTTTRTVRSTTTTTTTTTTTMANAVGATSLMSGRISLNSPSVTIDTSSSARSESLRSSPRTATTTGTSPSSSTSTTTTSANNNNQTTTSTSTSTTTTQRTRTDSELVSDAQELYQEEQLLAAARILRQVQDTATYFTEFHYKILRNALLLEHAVSDLLSIPSSSAADGHGGSNSGGWIKQGESHGKFDTNIYYKVSSGAKLTCRIETPIPTSLVVPLLSVLNESSLYDTWIPSWSRPFRLGISKSTQLINDTRGHQIIQVQCNVPWPITSREVIIDALAVDDIEAQGFIIVKMKSDLTNPKDLPEGYTLPPVERGFERIDFDGAILFRPCPIDHPCYESSREKLFLLTSATTTTTTSATAAASTTTNNEEVVESDNDDDELVLVQFTMYFDAHMDMVPSKVINFITRTVIGRIWSMLLSVAEDVKIGKQEGHQQAIQAKQDLYSWVKQRCHVMFEHQNKQNNINSSTTTAATTTNNDNNNKNKTKPQKSRSNMTNSSTSGITEKTSTPTTKEWTLEDALHIAS